MFTEVLDALDTLLYVDDMLQRFPSYPFSRILDQPTLPMQWSPFLNGYSHYKALASATSTLVCISKIAKHKVTWSKNSILVVTVAPDSGCFKFTWGEGLKKTSPSNPSKSRRLADDYTLHITISHSQMFVTCFVDWCAHTLSSQVKFLEYVFSPNIQGSECVKGNQYWYAWLMLMWRLSSALQSFV